MQFSELRKAMVDSQIRPNKVIDDAVIAAFATVPRELFVSRQMQNLAYIDEDIHLSGGRFIIEAMIMARMIQALELQKSDNVMSIGAGTGYGSAILSSLVTSVIAIETRAQMVEKAQQIVASLDIGNVAVVKSRLQEGYPSEAPYQAIIIEGEKVERARRPVRPALRRAVWSLFCVRKAAKWARLPCGRNAPVM